MSKIYLLLFAGLLLFIPASCKKKEQEEEECLNTSFDRKEMVSNLTTQYIVPAYDNYVQKAEALNNKVNSFASTPSEAFLTECRNAWKALAMAWQSVAFLEFGPAENIGLRSQTNLYPVDTALINNNIASGGTNLGLPNNYVAKGIQAIDYLLFLPNLSEADIVQEYLNSTEKKDYLKALSQELLDNAKTVASDWGSESTDFINNTASNAQGSAVSIIVNALSEHYEAFARKGKLGIPVGIFNGFSQTPLPGHAEAFYSGYSLELLIGHMEAIQTFIKGEGFATGGNGLGLDDYADFVSAKKGDENLSSAINTQIENIITDIESFSAPLSQYVTSNPAESKDAYQSMQKLVPLIKVDLTSALGVLITYQDNDGD